MPRVYSVLTVCTLAAAYLVYVQGNDGGTALMWAYDHARCIQLLVEYVPKVMEHMIYAGPSSHGGV